MILTDKAGHLVSDSSLSELHTFVRIIGIKPHWFRGGRGHPHYDLTTPDKRATARSRGATLVRTRRLLERMVRQ